MLASLAQEYKRYVAESHVACPNCPVARSGPLIGPAMFAWKSTVGDGHLDSWTQAQVQAFLADHLPRATEDDPRLALDAATCVRDVVYFLIDRGTYDGEDVELLVATAMSAVEGFMRARTAGGESEESFALLTRRLDRAMQGDDHSDVVRLAELIVTRPEAAPDLAGHLDTLAWGHERLGRFDEAIDVMRRAVAAGLDIDYDDHPSPEALIADLLLRAGRVQEAHLAWDQAAAAAPADAWVHEAAGCAYAAAGLHEHARDWRTRGLRLALDAADGSLLEILLEDRGVDDALAAEAAAFYDAHDWTWEHTGAPPPRPATGLTPRTALAWFPPAEHARALTLWPGFAGEVDHAGYGPYCAQLERALRVLRRDGVPRPAVVPVRIDAFCAWCAEERRDPRFPESRFDYAQSVSDDEATVSWPPGRNDPCWCASGRKYKKCCLGVA